VKNVVAWAALSLSLSATAAPVAPSEVPVLPSAEYRMPLQEVIAIGRAPYWRQPETPRWEPPELELPASKSRLEWAPHYSRDERDDFNGVRDQLNPQPRTKLFEIHF